MSKANERAYARRRYEKQQARAERAAKVRRERTIVSAVLASVIVVGLIIALVVGLNKPSTPQVPAASGTETGAPTPTGTASAPAPLPTTSPKQYQSAPPATDSLDAPWQVVLHTNQGDITLALDGKAAPQAVANMVFLSKEKFFDGTACHRLLPASLLQCGDPTATGTGGPGYSFGPIENAPTDNVYKAGTVAMARQSGNGSSMGSQFFLVFNDVTLPADAAGGYTVMGTITTGLDLLKQIGQAGTISDPSSGNVERPAMDVIIESVEVSQK